MSQIIKPVMLDETGQETNVKLTELGTKIDDHKDQTAESLSDLCDKIDEYTEQTEESFSDLSTQLGANEAALMAISEAIAAVHSVNGLTGNVVLDSTNISLNKFNNPKTISQVLSEEQASVNNAVQTIQQAIARTPVDFSTTLIEDDDYLLTLSLSTP